MTTPAVTLFALLAIAHTVIACSHPFALKNSVCVYISSTQKSWCDAQFHCQGIGGELLTGDTALRAFSNEILDSTMAHKKYFWVGITDMEEERKSQKTGWRWTNGSLISATLPWGSSQPGNFLNQDCVMYEYIPLEYNKLNDYYCAHENYFICQPGSVSSQDQQHFTKTDMFFSTDKDNYTNGTCQKNFTEVTKLECAARCLQEAPCKGFYFHQRRSDCILVLFTNAKLDLEDGNGWERFVVEK